MTNDIAQVLGKIEAGLAHVTTTIHEMKVDAAAQREATHRIESATTRGFGDAREHMARIEERLIAHQSDDDRRFAEMQVDVDRAHRKIGGVTAYPAGSKTPSGTVGDSKTIKRAGIGTIIGGLSALGYWLLDHLTSRGGH